MFATDSGFPARNSSNDARVTVRVQRNRQTPRFDRDSYSTSVDQRVDVGTQVLDLNANDGDSNVSGCSNDVYKANTIALCQSQLDVTSHIT